MIGMRMVEREAGGQVGGGQKLRRWQKHPLVHNMTALPREFAVLRRWTSRHSRWWISAVRKLRSRSSHGCGGLVLRVFFLFCGSVKDKVLSSFPVFFLAMNYHWTKLFFFNLSQWRKIGMRPFFGEKSTKPIKYLWTWAEIERQWRAGKEEGQIVRVSYLCSDLVWPRATRPRLVLTENERIIIS